jgi:nicotine blue oxidoreductase
VTVAAVVLAAGAASRFGSPKQQLLLPDVLMALDAAGLSDVAVVAGAHALAVPTGAGGGVHSHVCADWARGPGASLRCGLAALPAEADAAVVVLADGPDLAPAAVTRVVDAWRDGAGDVVAASYDGVRGHPLVLGRAAWDAIPDAGLRELPVVLVACDDLGSPGDVDSQADLPERFKA